VNNGDAWTADVRDMKYATMSLNVLLSNRGKDLKMA